MDTIKKILTILGIFILTIFIFVIVNEIFLTIYLSFNGLEFSDFYSLKFSIYTLVGMLGVSMYIICSKLNKLIKK